MWWFWTVYGSMIAAMVAWGFWLRARWKDMPELAGIVYDERIATGELPRDVSRERFTDAFVEAEGPRIHTYRWVAAAASILLLPILVRVFNVIWDFVWVMVGKPRVFEAGFMMHTFCTFLFAMSVIVAILFFTMRRYYKTAPPSLKKQLRTLTGETG